jgi:serine/threonine-protein kinase HipA
MGDFRLSPAYNLLNSRIHIEDKDFALDDGLLPEYLAEGTINQQFHILAEHAGLSEKKVNDTFCLFASGSERIENLIAVSYLDKSTKRNYWQAFLTRLKRMTNDF